MKRHICDDFFCNGIVYEKLGGKTLCEYEKQYRKKFNHYLPSQSHPKKHWLPHILRWLENIVDRIYYILFSPRLQDINFEQTMLDEIYNCTVDNQKFTLVPPKNTKKNTK